jgi:hypothetical protein
VLRVRYDSVIRITAAIYSPSDFLCCIYSQGPDLGLQLNTVRARSWTGAVYWYCGITKRKDDIELLCVISFRTDLSNLF